MSVYDNKFIRPKTKIYSNEINTNFQGNKIPEDNKIQEDNKFMERWPSG